ncbi:MAG: hypothetical protein AAB469_01780 [Patescibacteria group bacterium]
MPRFLKQIIIAGIFFGIIGLISYFSFFKDVDPQPANSVIIKPLEIRFKKFIKVKDFDYDFIVEIRNQNSDYGAVEASYELSLLDSQNQPAVIKKGSLYVLPNQTRYEIISPIKAEKEISKFEFKINNVSWGKLKDYIPETLFLTKNREYSLLPPAEGFSKLKATLFNSSSFDFDLVDVYIILFGRDDQILNVGKTDVRTFLASTERFFEIKWASPFEGEPLRIEIYPYTDVFKNENFIKVYGTQERFQEFY